MLYIDGLGDVPEPHFQAQLLFGEQELGERYAALRPSRMQHPTPISLVTLGCPQASVGELRAVAACLHGKHVHPDAPPLWVFTSSANKAIAHKLGLADIITGAGALLLENTCPEVVPYDPAWVKHVLTNSMKAEHYIKSGLNGIPTSVMKLADCVAVSLGGMVFDAKVFDAKAQRGKGAQRKEEEKSSPHHPFTPSPRDVAVGSQPAIAHLLTGEFAATGQGLPSQQTFTVTSEAFVTDTPITLLGFVNRETGVIEEEGHPANGRSLAHKIAIFPKGSGSTVAPYVLLELFYRGNAPIAIVNSEIDQQSAPACSLEGIPYAYGFDADVIANINDGDLVELKRQGTAVTIRVLTRRK
jgi:predicted aconitase with swiveling domain